MARKWWLALLALLIVTPALAQVMVPVQKIEPVRTAPVVKVPEVAAEENNDLTKKTMTIEEARARISQLTKEKRAANQKLKEALARIDEMTKPGGSLVRAYCSDKYTSRNTAGAEQKCERYTCNQVSGLCNQTATSSSMCAPGFNFEAGKCVTLEEAGR
ncbi:MAG TPA: hypothetical protein VHN55_01895 [Sphingomicrobium sp.]|nr:hypothetical protein [Sphingomicrobium sp.]